MTVLERVRSAGSRAAFRAMLRPRPPHPLTHLGTTYGGWAVPVELIDPSWVCYTAGLGEDASFDLALAELGCEVLMIDPTPRALEYAAPLLAEHANLRLAPYAVWAEDGEVEFFPPADAEHVSHSISNRQGTADPVVVRAKTLSGIAGEYGHRRVDLLKLDIEGAEYDVLDQADLGSLGVRVLCVEFHNDHGLQKMLETARTVSRAGFTVAAAWQTNVTFCRP